MVGCIQCSTAISRNRPGLFCSGCKNQIHGHCISTIYDIPAVLSTVPGLSWKCPSCINECIVVNEVKIGQLLESKVEASLSEFKKEIECIKHEINKASKNIPMTLDPPKYSDILKNKTHPAIIVFPKDVNQPVSQTKADILQSINPSEANIQLAKIKNVKNGGILIGCKNKDQNDKFKSMAQQKLSSSYTVKEVSGLKPKIRVVGMSENYSAEKISEFLTLCNPEIFHDDSALEVLKIMPLKKNNHIYQAVIQLDRDSYDKVIKIGNLFIGYDSCIVYDAIEILRCFKCNQYNHSASTCKNALLCPLCGSNHNLKDCKSTAQSCSNCLRITNHSNVSTDHAVWEKERCTAYKIACDNLRRDLLGFR